MQEKVDRGFSYLGINENGLARAIIYDDPHDKKWVGRELAKWVREGRSLLRLPTDEAVNRLKRDWLG